MNRRGFFGMLAAAVLMPAEIFKVPVKPITLIFGLSEGTTIRTVGIYDFGKPVFSIACSKEHVAKQFPQGPL